MPELRVLSLNRALDLNCYGSQKSRTISPPFEFVMVYLKSKLLFMSENFGGDSMIMIYLSINGSKMNRCLHDLILDNV